MTLDRIVIAFAGSLILISVALAFTANMWWLMLAGFVGLNLFQAAFTGFCPLAILLKRVGVSPGPAF